MVYYNLFGVFYLSKLLFSGFLQFKGNFVRVQNNSKCYVSTPLRWVKATKLFLKTENVASKYMLDSKGYVNFLYLSALKLNRRRASSDWQLPHFPHDVMDFRHCEFPWKDGLTQKEKVKSTIISVRFSFIVVSIERKGRFNEKLQKTNLKERKCRSLFCVVVDVVLNKS